MSLLDDLRMRNISFQQAAQPNEIRLCCPFCTERGTTPDTRFRLGVNTASGAAHCYNCEYKSWGEHTFKNLSRALAIPVNAEEIPADPNAYKDPPGLPEEFIPLKRNDPEGKDAWNYLIRRGVTELQIERYRVGYALAGRFAYRTLFPVRDTQNEIVGVIGRDYSGQQEPGYLYPTGMDKHLWPIEAWQRAKKRAHASLVVCEGAFDALSCERAGYYSVATLGRIPNEAQLECLKQMKTVTMMLDNDRDGVASGMQTAMALEDARVTVYVSKPPAGKKDAGDTDVKGIKESVLHAKRYSPSVKLAMQVQMMKE